MRVVRRLAKLTVYGFLGAATYFVHKVKSKEAHVMLDELKRIDERVQAKILSHERAKSEFKHLLHRLENTLARLKRRGKKFEAQHLYHVYERYAHAFKDSKLIEKLKKLHP